MELARAIMCPANCIAPQSIVAGSERGNVFLHPETVTPARILIARCCCACAANGHVAAEALRRVMNSRRRI
jgi:hypothetical protein